MNPVQIKICGLTGVEDALAAVECGATMLGLNFYPPSPRYVALNRARQIAHAVTGRVPLVGVFVHATLDELEKTIHAVPLNAAQLYGKLPADGLASLAQRCRLIRALPADDPLDPAQLALFHGLLVDTPTALHGGCGQSFAWNSVDWTRLRATLPHLQFYLAGGLTTANVAAAIAAAHPDVVDVCSGVEATKGIKDRNKMYEFVAAVRAAEGQQQ